jgi:hypothetical protein
MYPGQAEGFFTCVQNDKVYGLAHNPQPRHLERSERSLLLSRPLMYPEQAERFFTYVQNDDIYGLAHNPQPRHLERSERSLLRRGRSYIRSKRRDSSHTFRMTIFVGWPIIPNHVILREAKDLSYCRGRPLIRADREMLRVPQHDVWVGRLIIRHTRPVLPAVLPASRWRSGSSPFASAGSKAASRARPRRFGH